MPGEQAHQFRQQARQNRGSDGPAIPVVFAGDWSAAFDRVAHVFRAGFDVRVEYDAAGRLSGNQPLVIGIALDDDTPFEIMQRVAHQAPVAWFAHNQSDSPPLSLEAYQAGAQAVLPSSVTSEILIATVERLSANLQRERRIEGGRAHVSEQEYDRGQFVIPEEHAVLEVLEGILAVTVIHDDGAEVLLGLCGAGQTLNGHPEDSCSIRLVAHTAARVRFRPWDDALRDVDHPQRLRTRLQQMEAWAAMQARPHLDQRILGILSLLAEQFGSERNGRMVIDVRITHQQLAAAVGATRTTVTRILRDLKRTGQLATTGNGNSERFCLLDWEPHAHQVKLFVRQLIRLLPVSAGKIMGTGR